MSYRCFPLATFPKPTDGQTHRELVRWSLARRRKRAATTSRGSRRVMRASSAVRLKSEAPETTSGERSESVERNRDVGEETPGS
jgi:hypothetical protein